ncbi:MAG: rod shape-determining protein [Deinococcales bacterium]
MIGVDLGTTNVRIHVKGRGVVLREPAVIAVVKGTTDVKAVGEDAYRMLGRTPGNITAVRPMADGVIADYTLTEKMLKAFISKVLTGANRLLRPNIMVCIPSGITEVEKRAVLQAINEIGARRAFLIEEPVAGAIGAGINIADPVGSMVIDIGGGTTDIAIISMGGIVVSESLRIAGNTFDRDLMAFVKAQHNLLIGDRTAEEIKRTVGAAVVTGQEDDRSMEVRGRDLIDGMPKSVTITTEDVVRSLNGSLDKIAAGVRKVLEQAPPELVSDVIERGIVMTGGGAKLRNLDAYLRRVTNVPVAMAETPEDCVVLGTAKALDMSHVLQLPRGHRSLTPAPSSTRRRGGWRTPRKRRGRRRRRCRDAPASRRHARPVPGPSGRSPRSLRGRRRVGAPPAPWPC